jgi:hypothetical protein
MTKLAEIAAAVARKRGDSVVDLENIKSGVRIAICLNVIDDVWAAFDAGWVSADLAERTLQAAERHRNEEVASAVLRPSVASRAEQAQRLAEHRARRGARKVRGAK